MARGDTHWFASFRLKVAKGGAFNLSTDTLKMGIVTNTTVPLMGIADPRWGNGGSTDFSTSQVGIATAYTGPITLTGVTWNRLTGAAIDTLDFDDITVAQDASGFTNGYYGIVFDFTASGKECVGFVDLGGPVSIVSGPLNINVNASGFLTDTSA